MVMTTIDIEFTAFYNLQNDQLSSNKLSELYLVCPRDVATGYADGELEVERGHSRVPKHVVSESAEAAIAAMSASAPEQKIETVLEGEGVASREVGHITPYVPNMGEDTRYSIQNYFERPVLIFNEEWKVTDPLDESFAPYALWSSDPRVRAKLKNYAYFRGTLHLRVVMSGTPFHYGKLLLSYQPLAVHNSILSGFATISESNLTYLSQAKYSALMDVKANQPCDLVIPYMFSKPLLRNFNNDTSSSPLANTTAFIDFTNIGSFFLKSYGALLSVSGTQSVQISVYAWMTDVHLGTPTMTKLAISESDEFSRGPVEKFASNVANILKPFGQLPTIGPFAKASEIAFGSLSRISALFGWSKPAMEMQGLIALGRPYMSGAQCIGQDTTYRLVFDPKQEITADVRCLGYDTDDMAISSIVARETLIEEPVIWEESDAPLVPFSIIPVQPRVAHSGTTYNTPTALSFGVTPFTAWRGDITYIFHFVVSAFHRGKVGIFYEPNVRAYAQVNPSVTNAQCLKVVDLQSEQTAEVTVSWANDFEWLEVSKTDRVLQEEIIADHRLTDNGFLFLAPITRLSSPAGDEVNILVSTFSRNMHVNYVTFERIVLNRRYPEEEKVVESESLETPDSSCVFPGGNDSEDRISQWYFGEEPVSFRALLKRFVRSGRYVQSTTSQIARYLWTVYPNTSAYVAGSPQTYPNLYGYLRYAYVGIRGGARLRLVCTSLPGTTADYVTVTNRNWQSITSETSTPVSAGGEEVPLDGGEVFTLQSNGGVEFEVPFYSRNLFGYSFSNDIGASISDGSYHPAWNRQCYVYVGPVSSKSIEVIRLWAAGEDFSFIHFNGGCPYVPTPP